jgi:hypothetical protein
MICLLRIMSPIVLFIISLNLCLSLAGLWIAQQIVQWQKSLIQLNQSLTIAELSLSTRPQNLTDPAFENLQTQVQQFHCQIQPQLVPLLQFLSAIYRMQRLWTRTGQKLRSPATRMNVQQSARNPRRR